MKTFRLKANITFEAEDIDNAFQRLSNHFKEEPDRELGESHFFKLGEIEVKPDER